MVVRENLFFTLSQIITTPFTNNEQKTNSEANKREQKKESARERATQKENGNKKQTKLFFFPFILSIR